MDLGRAEISRLLLAVLPYNHPNGAVIWVNLDEQTQAAVREAVRG
jgi:hypothetical protein